MTNAEKFVEVFGTDLKRQYATKSWWDQEFVPPKKSEEVTCDDAISRQEAIDAFSMFAEYESNRTHSEWVDRIRVVLSSLPPVQPIRPRGHWILVSDKTPGGYWKCSECLCHKTMGFGHTDWFCPCCGADMRESEEKYQRRVKWVIPNWINTDNVESEDKNE